MERTQEEWIKFLNEIGCLWIHDGNNEHPHAELTSGMHSSGFFNASKIIENPNITCDVCGDLFSKCGSKLIPTQRVFGSAYGAIILAHELARMMLRKCGFTEPQPDKSMALKRFSFEKGTKILIIEDVLTTGGTTLKTIEALETVGGIVLPEILVVCNRSGMTHLDGREIIALVDKEMPIWTPDECPLCKAGSRAIRPKGNWQELVGKSA